MTRKNPSRRQRQLIKELKTKLAVKEAIKEQKLTVSINLSRLVDIYETNPKLFFTPEKMPKCTSKILDSTREEKLQEKLKRLFGDD